MDERYLSALRHTHAALRMVATGAPQLSGLWPLVHALERDIEALTVAAIQGDKETAAKADKKTKK